MDICTCTNSLSIPLLQVGRLDLVSTCTIARSTQSPATCGVPAWATDRRVGHEGRRVLGVTWLYSWIISRLRSGQWSNSRSKITNPTRNAKTTSKWIKTLLILKHWLRLWHAKRRSQKHGQCEPIWIWYTILFCGYASGMSFQTKARIETLPSRPHQEEYMWC